MIVREPFWARTRRLLSFLLALGVLLSAAGCDQLSSLSVPGLMTAVPSLLAPQSTATPTQAVTAAATPDTLTTPTPDVTRSANYNSLVLWVPPEFDPGINTPASLLLRARLEAFSKAYGAQVEVRVKAPTGPGSLLEALTAANAAAPLAMPSVVALPRSDLEVAALKGMLQPLDGVSTVIDESDWYDYARQLAMVQGTTFALPFAGDALVVAYRPARVVVPPTTWQDVFRLGQPLAFPAGDGQAMLQLALYESLGGKIEDAQRRPTLQADLLSQVLTLFENGEQSGIFPYWLSQYETYGQAWQGFRDARVNAVVVWASSYLSSLPADSSATALPALGDDSMTLATSWGWAVADPIPERRSLSVHLAEFLSTGEFLASWTEAAGYLPTRPSALTGWTNSSLKTVLSPVVISAQARPSNDLLASQGSVLKEALLKVLHQDADSAQAAQAAAERLAVPQTP